MSQPIVNRANTPNLYDINLSKEITESAEFLGHRVYLTNPTSITQEQSRSYDTSKKIGDRSSALANSLTTEPSNVVTNVNEMIASAINQITSLYKENNVELTPKFTSYIQKIITGDTVTINMKTHCLLNKLFIFMSEAFKKGFNEIFDITDAFIYIKHNRAYIKKNIMLSFVELTDEQIKELAANKDFYSALLVKPKDIDINFTNIDATIAIRTNKNQEKKEIMSTAINESKADKSKKLLIKKHVKNMLETLYIKKIAISGTLPQMIRYLVNAAQLTDNNTDKILTKINFFFKCFEDYNTIADTSILTDIICYKGSTKIKILLSILNITDIQIQFITSCESRYQIIKPWIGKGFPTTENIEHRINQFKKNNTTSNSTDVSARYSNPQSDIINLTNTENSYPTAINFQDTDKALNPEQAAKFDDSIEQLDYKNNEMKQNEQEEDDELFAWLDANPNFLAGPNSAINSNPELILPTKRPISPSLYSEEYNQNKIPKLDFSFLD